jgi:hypothetical protein
MATTRTFQDMLNEYLPNTLLKEELIMRDYILQNVQKDDGWKGGNLVVPFKGAGASSVKFGGLTDSADIAQSKYVRGNIADYREVWGSLIFNQRDLQEHDGKIPETTFLRLLPDELEDFLDYKKEVVSIQLGSGPHFALATGDGQVAGTITVNKIDRFMIDQKVILDDDDSAAGTFYVIAIDVNTKTVTLSATRGGAAADISAFTLAQNAKFYHDGVFDAGGNHDTFISMRDVLLSAANGGAATVHGQTKTAYPLLQAVNIDGSAITASNILEKMFDAYTEVRERSKGRATEYLMSLKHYGSVMKQLELQKGSYRVVEEPKESLYGWMEMKIANVTGQVTKIVGIQEMDDDIIPLVDWRSITFRSNGYFRKRISPDGREYFEVRNSTGYQYIVDVCLFGEMEYKKPGHSAIIHGVSY